MANQLFDTGENLVLDGGLGARSIEIGLYNDSTDALADGASYSGITTEPAGGSYGTQSSTGASVSTSGGTTEAVYSDKTFDTSDSSQTVDSVFIRDTSSGDLIASAGLDSSYDLSNVDSFTASNVGISLD